MTTQAVLYESHKEPPSKGAPKEVGSKVNRVGLTPRLLLPVHPNQRTSRGQSARFEKCHKRKSRASFDHFVGAAEQVGGKVRPSVLEVFRLMMSATLSLFE